MDETILESVVSDADTQETPSYLKGSIESWERNGSGLIRGADNKIYSANFRDFQKFKQVRKMIVMEVGQDVSFVPSGREDRLKAEDVIYDDRSTLFRFAYFFKYEHVIRELAQLAQSHAVHEKWSSASFCEDEFLQVVRAKAEEQNWIEQEKEEQKNKNGKVDEEKAIARVEQKIELRILKKKYEVLFSFFERTFEP